MSNDNAEFNSLLADKRHQELISSITELVDAFKATKEPIILDRTDKEHDAEFIKAISKNNAALDLFLSKIKSILNPVVNIEDNQDKVISALVNMTKSINSNLVELKSTISRPRTNQVWEFDIYRDPSTGLMESVIARQEGVEVQ